MEFISTDLYKEYVTDYAFIYATIIGSIVAILFVYVRKKRAK
ncbi:EYxxD motif small membrane protein [Bacillus marinisedimentorum]|nr:EYxxD motif small membrane protein [Bacillus marinisedimentorum]